MSRQSDRIRKTGRGVFVGWKYRIILEGIGVGIFAGSVVSAFRLSLTKIDEIRIFFIEASHKNALMGLWAILLLIGLFIGTAFMVKREPLCSGSGIPQVKGELLGKIKTNWISILLAKFFGGIMALGTGLALGREGPSIQLGAMAGKGFSRMSGRLRREEHLLMTCGAGAGLAAAFSAPLAGVVFALEELHKNFSTHVLLCTMASAVTGDWMASYIFGLRPVFKLTLTNGLPLSQYWMALALGILLGLIGVIYNKAIGFFQRFFANLAPKALKWVLAFIVVILLAKFYPIALGSGHNLVEQVGLSAFSWKALLVLLGVKFLFSTFSFGTTAPGGIFLPLLVLGALTGGLFTEIITPLAGYSSNYVSYFIILGMAGIFSSIVRAPITGIILISEMTGLFSNLLPISIVSLTSYLTAEVLGGRPIYDELLERLLAKSVRKKKGI